MKTALLQYPIHSAIKLLHSVLVRQGFAILSLNKEEGTMTVSKPAGFLKKQRVIDFKVTEIDRFSTRIDVSVISSGASDKGPPASDESLEEKLIDMIYHYF